jgi:hypothetical protein
MLGDIEMDDSSAMMSEHDENEQYAEPAVGTVKKSKETRAWTWLARKVRHVWDGGVRRFGISRDTVRSERSRPSLRSSAWMRGAPHRGFAAAMRRTKGLIAGSMGGRPPVGRRESWVQYSRKRRRCHRRTVSVRSHDYEGTLPPGPDSGQPDPEKAITSAERRPGHRSFEHGELLTQGQILEGQLAVAAKKEEGEKPKQVE